jgi:DNA-binding response OmpR family regulator
MEAETGKEKIMAKILVVDDEKSIRALCAEELADEGYDVVTAAECKQALDLIVSEKPSVVVLDIRMDDCDGLDFLQELRNTYPDLPIVLNTAYDSYREDVKSVAADYYVVKSYDLTELKSRIASLLKKRKDK